MYNCKNCHTKVKVVFPFFQGGKKMSFCEGCYQANEQFNEVFVV